MIKSPQKNVADLARIKPATSWLPVGRASYWATEAGLKGKGHNHDKKKKYGSTFFKRNPVMKFQKPNVDGQKLCYA